MADYPEIPGIQEPHVPERRYVEIYPGQPPEVKPLPILGTRQDRIVALRGGAVALVIVIFYVSVASSLNTATTWIEGISLCASLACVWLARVENIWTMPFGLVAVVLLGWFLLGIDLVAQGWLQYMFYVPIQFIGWWKWCRGGANRTELQISHLKSGGWLLTIGGLLLIWASCWILFGAIYESPAWLLWDTSVVASSVVAQLLMTWKKREAWWAWTLPVNVSSIGLFLVTESYAFVFLYVIFLANSIWGMINWQRLARSTST